MPGGREGVLFVNHEYVSLPQPGEFGVYPQTFPLVMHRHSTIDDEMHDVGASVFHLRHNDAGRWEILASPLTRRYDAHSPMVASGPALQQVRNVGGTLANCSGCHTPWNTVLTCEENFQDCVVAPVDANGRGRVGGRFRRDGSHFGWVVKIDPFDPGWTPVKHTALGRFRHENVAIRLDADAHVVAYMGDDVVTATFTSSFPMDDSRPARLREARFSRGAGSSQRCSTPTARGSGASSLNAHRYTPIPGCRRSPFPRAPRRWARSTRTSGPS